MGLMVPLLWGLGLVFAKAVINEFPPILLMSLRFFLAAVIMFWFAKFPQNNVKNLLKISLIAAVLQYSLTFTGLKGLDAGTASIILQLEVPFLVLLGAIMLNEKPGFQKWIGIGVAFSGVVIIVGEANFSGEWFSLILVLSGAFSWAVGQIYIRKLKNIDGVTVTAWVAIFAAPQLLLTSFLFENNQIEVIINASILIWLTIFYLGAVMTALGYYLWNTLIRKHDINLVAPFLLLLPVFTVIAGVAILEEAVTVKKIVGGVIVIIGVSFVTIEGKVKHFFNKDHH